MSILVGLVRVSTDKQNTARQHNALEPICWKVFEEKASGKLATKDRPVLLEAISQVPPGGMLAIHEVDRLGRNLLEGLIVLNDLFQHGIAVKVLAGIAAGEHTHVPSSSISPWPCQKTAAATSQPKPRTA